MVKKEKRDGKIEKITITSSGMMKKEIDPEIKHLEKTGIPRCLTCKKPMKNAYDTKLKKIIPYLWKCEHNGGKVLNIGVLLKEK